MKRKTLHYLIVLAIAGISMAGCKHDVDFKNLTLDSEVNVLLNNLPIGEMSATFNDLIGLVDAKNTTIAPDEDGVLVLTMDEKYKRDFHTIDLKDYLGEINSVTYLQKVMPELVFIPAGTSMRVEFPMTITFSGVNDNMSDERLDSMVIDDAKFTTRISSENLTISDSEIEKVTLRLGDQFRRAKGLEKVLDNFHLDSDVAVNIDDFTLVLMKDEKQEPGNDNVINTATITFVVDIKTQNNVVVAANSGFRFNFKVEFMDYSALYGFFEAGKQTRDINTIPTPLKFSETDTMILPVKEPKIELMFTYGMSMPLNVRINYIKAVRPESAAEHAVYATWGGSTSTLQPLNTVIPVDAPLDMMVKDSSIMLNQESQNGAIDRFFADQVDSLGYDYKLEVDRNREVFGKPMKQFRLTKNTDFYMQFRFTMPFKFNPGLKVTYADTIKDVNLQRASLDSLAAMTDSIIQKINKADLQLYLTFTNNIPLDLLVDVQFLGEDGKELNLPQLHDITIDAATKSGSVITPSEALKTIGITEDDFDEVAKTRNVRIKARISDEKKVGTAFLSDQKLIIKAGVTGDVKAQLHYKLTQDNK